MASDRAITFSHTMLQTFRRCEFKFDLSYRKGYYGPPSAGQARGSAGHKALETYYSGDRDPKSAKEAAWSKFLEISGPDFSETEWELLDNALDRYFKWAPSRDTFKVLSTEQHFVVDVGPYKLQGYIDGIVEMLGQTWLLEHKFNKRVSTSHLDLDMQVSTYMLAAYILGHEPSGVFYNIIRIGDGPTAIKEPVVRKTLYRNKDGLQYIHREMISTMEEADKFLSHGRILPIRNLTQDCSWDCPFVNVCLSIQDSGTYEKVLEKFDRKQREIDVENE